MYLKACTQESHLNIGSGIWVIVTVLSAGIPVTHLTTEFWEYLEENTSSAPHFTHEVFGDWHMTFMRLTASGWHPEVWRSCLIPAYENQ